MLSTDRGRAMFWAESAVGSEKRIEFKFPGGQSWVGRILESTPPHRFVIEYFGGSVTTFELVDDGKGGTDLTLADKGVRNDWRGEVIAGWVSVLMTLKAAADYSIDLRNHDPNRTWEQGYAEN